MLYLLGNLIRKPNQMISARIPCVEEDPPAAGRTSPHSRVSSCLRRMIAPAPAVERKTNKMRRTGLQASFKARATPSAMQHRIAIFCTPQKETMRCEFALGVVTPLKHTRATECDAKSHRKTRLVWPGLYSECQKHLNDP